MQKRIQTISLPEKVSVQTLSPLLERIKSSRKRTQVELDFKDVKECDTLGIAILRYFRSKHKNVSFKNISRDIDKAMESCPSSISSFVAAPEAVESATNLEILAERFLDSVNSVRRFFVLLSDEIYHTLRYLIKPQGIYPGEIVNQLYFMGYKSFPIVCLITFLVGVTISLTSAAQLKLFGADIYLSYFIGIAMVRELVPLMTGIILAGKIGAAITAEISTMKVLEEIDALKTMGVIPEKFLMVPRLIAITLTVPILVVLADFVGIFGGVLVAQLLLGIPPVAFLREMLTVVGLGDFLIGLLKTLVFSWAVVISAGYKGFFVQRGAEEVGIATTDSVVLSIAMIILLDCAFAFLLY